MLYPLAVALVWLAAGRARLVTGRSRPVLAAFAGAGALAIAALLYLPIVVLNGPSAVLANEFVSSAGWSAFATGLGTMVLGLAAQWTRDLPLPVALLAALGLAVSTAARPRGPGRRLPLAPLTLSVVLGLLVMQRLLPPPRVWTWLLPFVAICVGAGWHMLVSAVLNARAKAAPSSTSSAALRSSTASSAQAASISAATIIDLTAVLLAALLTGAILASGSVYASTETGVLPDSEAIARDLGAMLEPGDRVLGGNPAEPILAYYFVYLRLPSAPLTQPVATARRILVVANDSPSYRQSAPEVLRYHGLSGGWLTNLRELRRYPQATLYQAVNPG
jgi:hypothetical protein